MTPLIHSLMFPCLQVQSPSELEAGEAPREPTMEVPFNLDVLRKHLANVRLARRVLPEDVTARQVLLEASVHEVASERFKHEDAMFKQLGLKDSLHERNLQAWMWNWHQVLTERLQITIKDLIKAEVNPKRESQSSNLQLGPLDDICAQNVNMCLDPSCPLSKRTNSP